MRLLLSALFFISSVVSNAHPLRAGDSSCLLVLQDVFHPSSQPVGIPRVIDALSPAVERSVLPDQIGAIIQNYGPHGQPLAVQVFDDGTTGVFGTRGAVSLARSDVVAMKQTVHTLTGTLETDRFVYEVDGKKVTIQTASTLMGSARQRRIFSDVDVELTLVVQYDGFREAHFHDPDSPFAKAVHLFTMDYIARGESQGMIFSEAKAGSLDHVGIDAEATKSKAVKWSRAQIERGVQEVYRAGENQFVDMTFAEAVTGHSRVKFDWFLRLGVPPEVQEEFGGLKSRVVEGSVMFNLAGRNGNNSAVPFISQIDDFPDLGATGGHIAVDGFADNKPLSVAKITFSAEELALLREVTISAPFTPVEHLGRAVVNAAITYRDQGKLFKALRIIYTRLNYANDVEAFRIEMMRAKSQTAHTSYDGVRVPDFREIVLGFQSIVNDPEINKINILISSARDLLKLESLGHRLSSDAGGIVAALNQFEARFGFRIGELSYSQVEKVQAALNRYVIARLESNDALRLYVDYVLRRTQRFDVPKASEEKIFLSLTPSESLIASYSQNLARWKQEYPNLIFEHPQDLHMTVAFLGSLSPQQRETAKAAIIEFGKALAYANIDFKDASFQKVGRGKNDAIIALHFDPEKVDPRLKEAVLKFKQEMVLAGVVPDRHLNEFVPHITLCTLPPRLQGSVEHGDLARFLANEVPGEMASGAVTTDMRIMYRAIESEEAVNPVYRDIRFQDLVETSNGN